MTLLELLTTLRARDIHVWADGERLRYSAPSGALTAEIREELTTHKADLLAFLMETQRMRNVNRAAITKISRAAKLPLSINQRRFWFIDQLQPNAAFNCYMAFRIEGALNLASLEQSLNEIVRRHEALRTTFTAIDGEPFQIIAPVLMLKIKLTDLGDIIDPTARETEAVRRISEEIEELFDLAKGPLIRAQLLRLDAGQHLLVLTIHHIVTDGWSMKIFLTELTVLYEAFSNRNASPLTDPPVQYVDFAHWQSQWLQGENLHQELSHWKQRLKGAPEITALPTDFPRPAVQSFHGASEPIVFSRSLTDALKTLSNKQGVTLFMTLLAAFNTLLYRYTGQKDLVLGSPIAGRVQTEIENVIGLFINTLVLRTDLSGDPSFRELLKRVRAVALDAYAYQNVPFEKLIEELGLQRSLSFSPLFQVMFVLQNTPEAELKIPGASVRRVTIPKETALFDLFLSLAEGEQGLSGSLSYKTDLFKDDTIQDMAKRFQVLLHGIVIDPDRPISMLPLFTPTEKHQILVEWNDTKNSYPGDKCVHQLFEEQVERTPEAVAVVFQDRQLTYRDLNQRANQLARYLSKLGVGAETKVAISMDRSLEMIVVLLGVLKAGGAYVPMDSHYPTERLSFMMDDSKPSVLITQQHLLEKFPTGSVKVLCLDCDWGPVDRENQENQQSGVSVDNLAYLIYTSGSTGKPKGVEVTHAGLTNFTSSIANSFGLAPSDRALQFASISFDTAAEEIYPTLLSGAKLVLRTDCMLDSASSFFEYCTEWGVTVVDLPTAYWHDLVEKIVTENLTLPQSLRLMIIGGERAVPSRLTQWHNAVGDCIRLLNTYGPTEATVVATMCDLTASTSDGLMREVPIGGPISNLQTYILDQHLNPTPIGIPGEVHIGGVGLARGYFGLPDLTAEKFIPNPFSNQGDRLYKTGDSARYLTDGNIEFLGRFDHQVKIRGFRIELGEIESILNQHPDVQNSVAVVQENTVGDKRLTAYVVPSQGLAPTTQQLREFLKKKLPEYMVPSAFVLADTLPMTPNGKVDRKALALFDYTREEKQDIPVPPRDELELQLTKIWEKVLGVQPIGIRDDFFDLGGHSLLAVRLVAQIEKVMGKRLPVSSLFHAPSIEQFARLLSQEGWNAQWKSLVAIQPGGSRPPLFCVHAHDGNVLFWRDLARRLGDDQPFYALQPQGLDGEQPLHTGIDEMAAHYIKEMRTLQPQGPYCIGGHCFGGVVAFEMAQQLHAQGERVALLALFDSYAPRGDNRAKPSRFLRYRYRAILFFERIIGLHIGNLSVLSNREKIAYLKGKLDKLFYKIYMSIGSRWIPAARNRRRILKAAILAARNYHAKVYPGKITLFRAQDLGGGTHRDPEMGWRKLAGGGLDVHVIPGYHAHIVLEPRVRGLAPELTSCISELQQQTQALLKVQVDESDRINYNRENVTSRMES